MTLNSIITPKFALLISPNSVAFGAHYVKVVEDTLIHFKRLLKAFLFGETSAH